MEKLSMAVLTTSIDKAHEFYTSALAVGVFAHDEKVELKLEGVLIGLTCVKGLIMELGD